MCAALIADEERGSSPQRGTGSTGPLQWPQTRRRLTTNNVCQEIRDVWPRARCRHTLAPFRGVGVGRAADAFASRVAQARLDKHLKVCMPRFPTLTVVRLELACFGAACGYEEAVWGV